MTDYLALAMEQEEELLSAPEEEWEGMAAVPALPRRTIRTERREEEPEGRGAAPGGAQPSFLTVRVAVEEEGAETISPSGTEAAVPTAKTGTQGELSEEILREDGDFPKEILRARGTFPGEELSGEPFPSVLRRGEADSLPAKLSSGGEPPILRLMAEGREASTAGAVASTAGTVLTALRRGETGARFARQPRRVTVSLPKGESPALWSPEGFDRAVERDARRYGGGFALY